MVSYSEKERAIFEGIISLMKRGANPYSIKVADMAYAAGVGKGTIYEYFPSKEEAISEAILYSINGEIEEAYSRVEDKEGFRVKFYEMLHFTKECMDNKISTINMLLSVGGIQEFYEFLSNDRYDISIYVSRINDLFEHLLETGDEEGIISTEGSPYYRNMAIASAVMGFSQYLSQRDLIPGIGIDAAMEASYKLLIKALN